MTAKKLPKATHTGTLEIGGIEIPCANLDDGRRVLSERGTDKALTRGRGGSRYQRSQDSSDGAVMPVFLGPKMLKPFVSDELLAATSEPIVYRQQRGRPAHGVDATALPMICEMWLKARDAGVLTEAQERVAARADTLMRGLAHVGITALVDEATGYQEDRDRHDLQRILEAYISKELLPWTKRFPDDFYKELFRLREWRYSPMSVARPSYVGRLTNELVYDQLPPGVLDELRRKNPTNPKTKRRSKKLHQFLTDDIGNPHLEKQIASVVTLMRASVNWQTFKRLFARAFPPRGGSQEQFEFYDNDADVD